MADPPMSTEEDDITVICPFLALADELIDYILTCELIDHRDICRFGGVCRRFNAVASANELWRKKACQRWRVWKFCLPTNITWVKAYQLRLHVENKLKALLAKMARECYTKPEVGSDIYDCCIQMVEEDDGKYSTYVEDTLNMLIMGDIRKLNLTDRYFAERVLSKVKIHQLKKEWKKHLTSPECEIELEKGAVLLAKWINHKDHIDEEEVLSKLDSIASRVKEFLQERRQTDVAINREDCCQSRDNATFEVLNSIKHVLFKEMGFSGNADDYYDVKNSMIHEVLKTRLGIPISLSVLFMAVARRVGVKLEPVNFPSHFLLRCKQNQGETVANDNGADDYIYIDCFNQGRLLTQKECLQHLAPAVNYVKQTALFPQATAREVYTRMVVNIVNIFRTSGIIDNSLRDLRKALELLLFLKPDDQENRLLYTRILVHLGINLEEAIQSLQQLLETGGPLRTAVIVHLMESAEEQRARESLEDQSFKPKPRSDRKHKDVAFKVGMVMRHRRYHYGCVIYGWDPECQMDEGWIQQMGVRRLPSGPNQPFYNVLGDDGSCRYAAQESLAEEPGQEFNPHPEVGRHFKTFTGKSYIPNEFLQARYPEDT